MTKQGSSAICRSTCHFHFAELAVAVLLLGSPSFAGTSGTMFACGVKPEPSPVSVPDVTAMAAGVFHFLVIKADSSISAWGGWNDFGELNVPAPNTGFIAVAAGYIHSLGLKSNGTIDGWGNNTDGQCDVPGGTPFIAVASGNYHSMGLRSDGEIAVWGWNGYDQYNVPSPNTGFTAIASGGHWCMGLRSDGSIAAWGDNSYSQCEVPSPNTGFIAIAAGTSFGMGLKADGSIIAWGRNDFGQCVVPVSNIGYKAIACGSRHASAIRSDGSFVTWGYTEIPCYESAPGEIITDVVARSGYSLYLNNPETTSIPAELSASIRLLGSIPNPFNPSTTVVYEIAVSDAVTLQILDVHGRFVRMLVSGLVEAGSHEVTWDGRDEAGRGMASGIYFARLEAGGKVETVRMSLIR